MVVYRLVFLAVGLVDGTCVTRMLRSNRAISDAKTGCGIPKTHGDGSLEWRVDGSRDEVGGDREGSCTLPPAVLCTQYW